MEKNTRLGDVELKVLSTSVAKITSSYQSAISRQLLGEVNASLLYHAEPVNDSATFIS